MFSQIYTAKNKRHGLNVPQILFVFANYQTTQPPQFDPQPLGTIRVTCSNFLR